MKQVWSTAKRIWIVAAIAVLLSVMWPAAAENMIGRQSQNEGILVLPAPAKVAIDGDLAEWDWSGRIWVFVDKNVRSRYSVEAAAMWDAENLYLGAKWRDPTPMYSTVDPEFNPEDGWKSDSWQMRFRTDKISHLTTWYFTPKKMPVLHGQFGKSATEPFGGPGRFHVCDEKGASPGRTKLGRGIEMAYKMGDDGKSFSQELKLPWSIIWEKVPEIKPGVVFQVGNEFLWGDPSGKTWPVHRYADNMQQGVTSREFYWTSWKAWGNAELVANGKVPVREYVDTAEKLAGVVPVRVDIPASAARFTIAINGADGSRVRNLAGDFIPDEYTVEVKGATRTVGVMWDCLDDKGRLVRPGTYRVIGLAHDGLGADYEMCYYNPGTPPWQTSNGSGGWGADHTWPSNVARSGDWMIVSWAGAEGGSGIIGVGPDGLKKWGEKRGAIELAADDKFVYAVLGDFKSEAKALFRLGKTDGSYKPFALDGKPRPFELGIDEILKNAETGTITGLAACGGKLAVSLSSGKLAILDAQSAKPIKTISAPGIGRLAYSQDGKLYALIDGAVHAVNVDTGKLSTINGPGVDVARDVAIDNDGNIALLDAGPNPQVRRWAQVKVFTPEGKLVYTCGKTGGRPIRGAFDKQAMMSVSAIDVDASGNVWATEAWNYPRRVSVWGKDGKLVRDYIGNTGYAGTSCYLHDDDPTLGYVGPVEVKLDREKNTWDVSRILWLPDETTGEAFEITTGTHAAPNFVSATINGKKSRYLFAHEKGLVVYMERDGKDYYQPAAAICLVGHFSGEIDHYGKIVKLPSGEFEGLSTYDGCFWNDRNRDGAIQRAECTIVPTKNPGKLGGSGTPALQLDCGWGGRLGSDLAIYASGITEYRPKGFTDDGAPVYGPLATRTLGIQERGDFVPVAEDKLLLCLSFTGYAAATTGMLGIDLESQKILWSYPNLYPGVHGSHRAIMPKPGLLIGPLKICGVADAGKDAGKVFMLRGNLGQDFLMTTDGLFVGAMFQDCRLPAEPLPAQELRGMPVDGMSEGGEPFNGWFGKQADGKVRNLSGIPRQASMLMEIKGLDTIKRFKGADVSIDNATLVKADRFNREQTAAASAKNTYAIKRMDKTPAIDAKENDWRAIQPLSIERDGAPEKARARMAYDDANLYVLFEVFDSSPWMNEGKDFKTLFKTGDAVDIQLNADPVSVSGKKRGILASHVRLLFAQVGGKPVCVLMKPIDKAASGELSHTYQSPVGDKVFDRIEMAGDVRVSVRSEAQKYWVEAAIPLSLLGLKVKTGMAISGDLGFISSDAAGQINVARTYWSNTATNLVNDMPLEAWLYPDTWGELKFE